MGVKGLWKLLESAGQPITLESLENKILAVDISLWLNESLRGMRDHQGSLIENAHLLGLFYRLCKLLFFKIRPVFVFDGGVPLLKKQTISKLVDVQRSLEEQQTSLIQEHKRQERMAASVSNEMYSECQELLSLFGIPYIVSPMEAEAQCAVLDFTNQTDGTITDDSDIFLFGGRNIYRYVFRESKLAEFYDSQRIQRLMGLDRKKMITLAYLLGSDYTDGIKNVGIVMAMELLSTFGDDLTGLQKIK
ncbi:uncharacterized protein TRIADDRAFT_23638 [Trichoplax adhaerens]|uniref:XPG N-terminal domain-containing protein n=1 Tax=Trichoplax adhaerens TaxID=10228 RepID=B3RTZ7_TRIAD|nr:hypothetical protein TRIADDRAFT_23638 [Trichoplax adhaerens]EDV26222.1 hypothetical protein TRIADDRAFT_23638 [Trichoplax adhaerens]|eukprot:XP_002112255.1 hypothetical protein TRIADDRAFT_23638 [Trichoplax adhaerens]